MPLSFVFGKFHVTWLCPFAIVLDSLSNFTLSAYKSNVTSGFTLGSVASFSDAHSFVALTVTVSGTTFFIVFVIVKPSFALPLVVTVYVSLPNVIAPLSSPASFTV